MCFQSIGIQPPLVTVFRGKGIRICDDEKRAWHPFVHVFFQEHVWVDTSLACQWMEKIIKSFIEEEHLCRYIPFCGNLTAQTLDQFKEAVSDGQVLCSMGCTMPQTYGIPNYMIRPPSILVPVNHLPNTFEITDIDLHKYFLRD